MLLYTVTSSAIAIPWASFRFCSAHGNAVNVRGSRATRTNVPVCSGSAAGGIQEDKQRDPQRPAAKGLVRRASRSEVEYPVMLFADGMESKYASGGECNAMQPWRAEGGGTGLGLIHREGGAPLLLPFLINPP